MLDLWQENTNAQYTLDAYATTKYVSSYITKKDRAFPTDLKKIKEESLAYNEGRIQTIHKLGNAFLNMQ